MSTSSTPAREHQPKAVFVSVLIAAFIVPILTVSIIAVFKPGDVLTATLEIATYLIIYLLTFWGLRKDSISLVINGRKLLGAMAFLGMGWLFYAFLLQIAGMAPISDEFHHVSDMSAWRIGLRILEMWFLVGLCEELLFRGYCLERIQSLLTGFSRKWRTSVAVTITSIVFSLWHLPVLIHNVTSGQSSFIVAAENIGIMFWVGVGLAYLFIRSRNIILVGLVHGAMDFPLRDLNFLIVFTVIACFEVLRLVKQKRFKRISVGELDGLSA